MANLTTFDKQILEKLFQMGGGYVLNFTDRTMGEFFKDDVGINIYDPKYDYATGSKANYMRGLWSNADDKTVGKSILKLLEYINNQIFLDELEQNRFPSSLMNAAEEIAERLLGGKIEEKSKSQATFRDGNINIELQKEIFDHVQELLNNKHYSNAIEEAYKIVRCRLKEITGEEKATEAFRDSNYEKIFGHRPRNEVEKDFCEGVKFLHMSIQFLRNERAHTPAHDMEKNLAIHYISLASLAYDLITRENHGGQ